MTNKLRIVGVSAGIGQPSRTTALVRSVLQELETLTHAQAQLIEIAQVGQFLGPYLSRPQLPAAGEAVVRQIEQASILVAGSPVYKGAYTGQFKHVFDMLDPSALTDVPVVLAATGGSDRHTLMTDYALRPLFAFFRAQTVPTSLYATANQFDEAGLIADNVLRERTQIAARQALHLLPPAARRPAALAPRSQLAP